MRKSNAVRKPPKEEPPTAIRAVDFFGDPILSTDAIADKEKQEIADLLNDSRKALHEFRHYISVFKATFALIDNEIRSIRCELETSRHQSRKSTASWTLWKICRQPCVVN